MFAPDPSFTRARPAGAKRWRLWLAGVLVLGLLTILAALPAAAQSQVREIQVTVDNFSFSPDAIDVQPGETVRFVVVNASPTFHTFTIVNAPDDRGQPLVDLSLQPEQTATAVVTIPETSGQLYLFCRPHEPVPMKGAVHVHAPAATDVGQTGSAATVDEPSVAVATGAEPASGAATEAPAAVPSALPSTGDGSTAASSPMTGALLAAALAVLAAAAVTGVVLARRTR